MKLSLKKLLCKNLETVLPISGYSTPRGFPVQPVVNSLDDAVKFLKHLASDMTEPFSTITDSRILDTDLLSDYTGSYLASIDEFTTLVNKRLSEEKPTSITDYKDHIIREFTTHKKLDALLKGVEWFPIMHYHMNEIISAFNFFPKKEKSPKKKKVKHSTSNTENKNEIIEEKSILHDNKGLASPKIKNNFTNYYIADTLINAFSDCFEKKYIFKNYSFPSFVKNLIAQPYKSLIKKLAITTTVAITSLLLMGYGTYSKIDSNNKMHRFQEIQKTLTLKELDLMQKQYSSRFNKVISEAKKFKSKYWLDKNVTSRFYNCTGEANPKDTLNQVNLISNISGCINEFYVSLRQSQNVPYMSLLRKYLDNYNGFSQIIAAEVDTLHQLELDIGKSIAYNKDLVKAHTDDPAVSNKAYYLIAPFELPFEKQKQNLQLNFTVTCSPMSFFSLMLANDYCIKKGTLPDRKTRSLFKSFSGELMTNYMVHSSPEFIRAGEFWKQSGDFGKAIALFQKYYR